MSRHSASLLSLAAVLSTAAAAQDRIAVSVENLAPRQGTFQTPVWIGVHDGTFDMYDSGQPASGPNSPLGDNSLETLAEDGGTGPIAANFLGSGTGTVETTVFGPNGPIAPGDRAYASLLVDPLAQTSRYFSYASMVLPSNDAFVANGNPLAHMVYDGAGNFVFADFIDNGVLDAGTEVNDELPMNTAFFGQTMPNTGVPENGVVMPHLGFNPRGSGGILDDFRYSNGDFTLPGYSPVMVRIRRATAIVDDRDFAGIANGANQVPAVSTNAGARIGALLRTGGTTLEVLFASRNLSNVVGADLHLGAAGATGPVIANLIAPREPGGGPFGNDLQTFTLTGADLTGPLADFPLDALVAEIEAGNVYFNVRTSDGDPNTSGAAGDNPDGEIRAQLARQ
ncbi:MAG: spondin domain-containing protein [Planctomycetota bacterium]